MRMTFEEDMNYSSSQRKGQGGRWAYFADAGWAFLSETVEFDDYE
jgi:hypothetical protein